MSDSERLGLACESTKAADRTISATLEALGAPVSPGDRREIAKNLPEHYAANIWKAEGEVTTAPEHERAEAQLPDQYASVLEPKG
ncbi:MULTISPECIES: hypothetical protein [Halolamina]|uniref:Uncharacterized protein n=1 Tax=Halolamina pelagica TaxID=699431 RepID=A0A1I5TK05_9EURY|nr:MULTISPECIES: hypothetical protein [Halolamina]NHX37363.1 hypothetical protein [Halolamina sp. R1-12]SFP82696.1 hypothetical protein SAMN05216277_10997 [Halolamina pelagica]